MLRMLDLARRTPLKALVILLAWALCMECAVAQDEPATNAPPEALDAEDVAPVILPAVLPEPAVVPAPEAIPPEIVPDEEPAAPEAAPEEPEAEGDEEEKPADECGEAYDNIEMMTQVIMHIRKHYVDEKTYKDIAYGALHGMLRALDTHSDFLEPKAYKAIKEETSGSFSGIGIHIGLRHGILTVIAPIEDTPAFRAGVLAGDLIIEIEGESTAGITLRDAVDKLRGVKGTEVTITIRRLGEDDPLEITIVRDDIEVPSVKGTRIIEDGIGYTRITQFARPTAGLLKDALAELQGEDMRALVLDLRSNPGGLLGSAIEVAQFFLEKGTLIVTTRGREGVMEENENKADGETRYTDMPMVVLVNEGSASASEIVAGCLQDHGRAVLVGERTFGKGSVQSVIRLPPDEKAAIRLTTAYYYTPSGRLIHDKGIDPDILEEVSPREWRDVLVNRAQKEAPDLVSDEEREALAGVEDRQLLRALDMLKAVLIFQGK